MRVLFVSSGNKIGISPIIKNQAESLIKAGCEIDYYLIKGSGIKGYLKNIAPLRKKVNNGKYDIVHAHYSLTAFITSIALSNKLPIVVSLMGSDVKASYYYKLLIIIFSKLFSWKEIIVKSLDMYKDLGISKAKIIPNGVDMLRFSQLSKNDSVQQLGWNENKINVLFPSNPNRLEKNYSLLKEAVSLLEDLSIEVHCMIGIPNEQTPILYNAADIVVMTSLWEGSPNAIKEALACGVPVVTTDVGDVHWLIGESKGNFITSYDPKECADAIRKAIEFSRTKGKTKGRERIIEIGLDNFLIANNLIEIYNCIYDGSNKNR